MTAPFPLKLSSLLPLLPSYPTVNFNALTLVLPSHPFCKSQPSWINIPSCFLCTYTWASTSYRRKRSIYMDPGHSRLLVTQLHLYVHYCLTPFPMCLDTLCLPFFRTATQAFPTFRNLHPTAFHFISADRCVSHLPESSTSCPPPQPITPHSYLNPCWS